MCSSEILLHYFAEHFIFCSWQTCMLLIFTADFCICQILPLRISVFSRKKDLQWDLLAGGSFKSYGFLTSIISWKHGCTADEPKSLLNFMDFNQICNKVGLMLTVYPQSNIKKVLSVLMWWSPTVCQEHKIIAGWFFMPHLHSLLWGLRS